MGLFDFIKGQTIEILQWENPGEDTLCWKFPHEDNAIKNGAKLIVREGQRALFVHMGALPEGGEDIPNLVQVETPSGASNAFIGDTFGPGTYTLETRNMPILNKILGWKYGFESPFKADVYFVATRRFQNMKWGTSNPFMMRDPEFGPVRIRAFGTYAVQVSDPVKLLRELVANDPQFSTFDVASQLRSLIVTRFTDRAVSSKIPVLDMAANLDEFSRMVQETISEEFEAMGLSVPLFLVENISLPPELEKVFDTRAKMGILGDLDQYQKLQAAEAMRDMAKNSGGGGGNSPMNMGMGLSAGMAMGQQFANAINPQQQQQSQQQSAPPPAAVPPPLPQQTQWFAGIGGQQAGPFDENAVQQKIQAGEITRETLMWKEGMPNWSKAGDLPDLAKHFGSVPPPLPPG